MTLIQLPGCAFNLDTFIAVKAIDEASYIFLHDDVEILKIYVKSSVEEVVAVIEKALEKK